MRTDDRTLWLPGLAPDAAALAHEVPDLEERERALDPARSFVVQAPAGSGKTELLIQRYLTLLARATAPEGVVAITFTIKAAGEMRQRVAEALESAGGEEPARPHERATWRLARAVLDRDAQLGWNLARSPGRLRIQTIDALCMAVTRQMPWLARMGAMPNVVEDAASLYASAAESTLRLLGESGPEAAAVECLLRHVDYDAAGARELLARMLEVRDHWSRLIEMHADPRRVRFALEQQLQSLVKQGLRNLRQSFPMEAAAELMALSRFAAAQLDSSHPAANCRDLLELPGEDAADLPAWRGLASLLLTDKGEWRKSITTRNGFPPKSRQKERFERLIASFRPGDNLRAAFEALGNLPAPNYSEPQWEALDALFTLLPRAVAELRVVFAARETVDFVEIAQAARDALGTADHPTDLALALGHRIEHLLVDEFQDTSRAQYELLSALTAGWDEAGASTLFLVGDPMQSIYRFRQADVGLYLSVRERGLGALRLEPATLSVNFRSAPAVVEWINETFVSAFPAKEDALRGGVAHSPSQAFRPADAGAGVFVHPLIGRRDAAEAERVVRLIEEERAAGASVTVLVRARTHLAGTARLLRERGIPIRAIEIDSLGERPTVLDALSLTRALLHLADRPAWLAILRAPWCGLTLADLEAIAGNDHHSAIWDLLRNADRAMSADGMLRLGRVVNVITRALDQRGRVALRTLVEGCWMSLGGPQCLPSDGDLADVMTYFDLLGREEKAGDLADLDAFGQKVNELFAAPDPAAPLELELMTVHKAKGLEFDCVIIPGIGRAPKREDEKLLSWSERQGTDGPEVLLAPMAARHAKKDPVYHHLQAEERARTEFETVRLLYVACTRARRRLHLVGHIETSESDGVVSMSKPESGSFLEVLWPRVHGEFEAAFAGWRASPDEDGSNSAVTRIRRLPRGWPLTGGSPPTDPVPEHPRRPAAIDTEDREGRQTGTLIHRFLEQIGNDAVEKWSAERVKASRAAIESALAGVATQAHDTVEAALLRTLADTRGRWILSAHSDARSEFAIAGVVGGVPAHFRVDRTFVDETGVRWVIDFKTGQMDDLEQEKLRHAPQVATYASLLREMDDRPIRAGLYFPLTGAWIEWDA